MAPPDYEVRQPGRVLELQNRDLLPTKSIGATQKKRVREKPGSRISNGSKEKNGLILA